MNSSENSFSMFQSHETFLRGVFESILKAYFDRNPIAKSVWECVQTAGNEQLGCDHFTFRTLGVDGLGMESLASFFSGFGYKLGGGLDFSAKKLRVKWFSPPQSHRPLPRIVLAEVLVDQLTHNHRQGFQSIFLLKIIRKCLKASLDGNKYAMLSSIIGNLMWDKPTSTDFDLLARENEYAAWTLAHGNLVNHVAISVHQMNNHLCEIEILQQFLEQNGFNPNTEGGILKVSPDGQLRQISSLAERVPYEFADGVTLSIPSSYIEFTDRLVMPQYKHVLPNEIEEFHRRDGFEFESANNIMESTRIAETANSQM